jgi:two-component system, LytTR family, response regulator
MHLDLVIIGECSDGLEAVQKSEELQPDLVLLDIGLPNLTVWKPLDKSARLHPLQEFCF